MRSDSSTFLDKNIATLKGVGEKTGQALAANGVVSIFDALLRVPKSIVEEMACPGFAHMEAGRTYVATGTVMATKVTGMGVKRRLEAIIEDDSGRMYAVFFGNAVNYATNILKHKATVALIGEAKNFLGRLQMVHPKLPPPNSNLIEPASQSQYSQIAGISPQVYKKLIEQSLKLIAEHNLEHLAEHTLEAYQLAPLQQALLKIHKPDSGTNAWDQRSQDSHFKRLAFEELLAFYLRMFGERAPSKHTQSYLIPPLACEDLSNNFLPFALTKAQERVISEVISDLSTAQAMTRLIQGDVGSGKTAVSACIARHVISSGLQVAIMAPTEILAEQLFSVFTKLFANTATIAFLSGSTKAKQRREIVSQISMHQIHIIIGTHALLSEDLSFARLGLVIIDEQHRFGVNQRAALVERFSHNNLHPHLLVMSATPIPRSLALTIYGDLDLSVIDERPPGRVAISTKIMQGLPLTNLERLCERIILSEQKAFVVFPLVEESEHFDLENATKAALHLQEKFGTNSTRLLTGKMKSDEKQASMQAFRDNHIRFLVSTTVVEVGVDIPDATCMIIIHPERFGLAQLHQLRGRVGRGQLASFCFLLTDIKNRFGTAFKRLDAMCRSDNGFELAQVDLDLRGPGELLGTKQAGLPNFLVFNYSDFGHLVEPAKKHAQTLAKVGPNPQTRHLFPKQNAHFS